MAPLGRENTLSEIAAREEISRVQLPELEEGIFRECRTSVLPEPRREWSPRHGGGSKTGVQERERDLMAERSVSSPLRVDWLKKICTSALGPDWGGGINLVTQKTLKSVLSGNASCSRSTVQASIMSHRHPQRLTLREKNTCKARKLDFWHTKMCYLGVRRLAKKLTEEELVAVGRQLVKLIHGRNGYILRLSGAELYQKTAKEHKCFSVFAAQYQVYFCPIRCLGVRHHLHKNGQVAYVSDRPLSAEGIVDTWSAGSCRTASAPRR